MQERVIVGIDVGTTKICVLVGELDRDGKLNIVGVGTCPSQGLRRGVVVNIEETVTSIAAALDRAERLSGKTITTAYVGIAADPEHRPAARFADCNNRPAFWCTPDLYVKIVKGPPDQHIRCEGDIAAIHAHPGVQGRRLRYLP